MLPLAVLLAGCNPSNSPAGSGSGGNAPATGSNASGPNGSATTSGGKPFKVGLVTTGSLTDSGWNALAGKGLEQIKNELHAEVNNQSSSEAEAEDALRGFAREGYRLVFAHGGEYQDAAKRVAQENPDTIFVVSTGEVQGPNLASLRFDLGDAAYLAGMAAAALSKSGKAGQIGGQSFPPVKQAFELFEKGGKTIKPSFTTNTTYLGNWSDANAAKEKALGMIRDGADIIFQNADAAGQGVFDAAKSTKDKQVLVIGSNANQNDLMPDVIAASAVLDVPKAFLAIARDVQGGTFKGAVYKEDLKSGNVYLAINPAFKDKIPADVTKKIEQAEADLKSGKLTLTGK
jgi:basic membrane lipoprotein Med (substrate-binding protein (PBP1-ABC) superfamily)